MADFLVDMRPFRAGQSAPLEDALADRMLAEGVVSNLRPFPEGARDENPAPVSAVVPVANRAMKPNGRRGGYHPRRS